MNNASALTFTTSAVIVSYILIEQLTTNQQDIIGGWFNIVGEILSAAASWNSTIEEQLSDHDTNTQTSDEDNMETLRKTIEKIEEFLKSQKQDDECELHQ